MSGSGQKHYKLLRLRAAKSTTEHMGKIVPVPESRLAIRNGVLIG